MPANEDRQNQLMVEQAYNRVLANPRDELERALEQMRQIQQAALAWARVRQNPKAPRRDLKEAENALVAAVAQAC